MASIFEQRARGSIFKQRAELKSQPTAPREPIGPGPILTSADPQDPDVPPAYTPPPEQGPFPQYISAAGPAPEPVEPPIGMMESFRRQTQTPTRGMQLLPGVGSVAGAAEGLMYIAAGQRLKSGYDYSKPVRPAELRFGAQGSVPARYATREADEKLIGDLIMRTDEEQRRGFTTAGTAAKGIAVLPKYAIEFMLTGGLASMGSKVFQAAGTRVLRKYAKTAAGRVALKTAGWAGGAITRGSIGLAPTTAEKAAKRQVQVQVLGAEDEGWATSLVKAWGDTVIEAGSETAGAALTGIPAKLLSKTKFGSKLVNSLRKGWMAATGGTKGAFTRELTKKGGFTNILDEFSEERLGTLLRAVTDVDDFGAGSDAKIHERVLAGIKQDISGLGAEAMVLAVPMASQVAGGISAARTESTRQQVIGTLERGAGESAIAAGTASPLDPPSVDEPVAATMPEMGPGSEGFTPTVTEGPGFAETLPGTPEPAIAGGDITARRSASDSHNIYIDGKWVDTVGYADSADEAIGRYKDRQQAAPPESAQPKIVAPATAEASPTVADAVAKPPAVPVEGTPAAEGQDGLALRNVDIDVRREAMGLPIAPEMAPRGTMKARREQAIREGHADIAQARATAAQILDSPRPATDLESYGMNQALSDLQNQIGELDDQLVKLPMGSKEYIAADQQWAALRKDAELISRVGKWAGSEWGHSGLARQLVLDDNGEVVGVLARVKKATGKDLDAAAEKPFKTQVRGLRRRRKLATTATKRDAANHLRTTARKVSRLGRLAKMTDAEKDTQLQDLLGREQTEVILTDIFMNMASRDQNASIDSVVQQVRKYLPDVTHNDIVDAFDQASKRKAKNTFGMEHMLKGLRTQLKKEKHKLTAIDDLLYWIKQGKLPEADEASVGLDDKVVRDLQVVLDQVTKLQKDSQPYVQRQLEKKIAYLKMRLAAGDFGNKPQALSFKPSKRTLDLQYEAHKLDAEISRRIFRIKQKQRNMFRRGLANATRSIMSMKSSFDNSGLLNQGGFVALSHPIKAIKTIPKAFSAALSDKRAFLINQEILSRPNAPLYQRYELGLTQASDATQFTEREEEHRESWADFIPGVKASNRAFATTLNLLRADSFDAMAGAFGHESGLTDTEGQAVADFINMATGRGNIRGFENSVRAMNGILWAPRRTISRFQMIATLGGQIEYGSREGGSKWRIAHLRADNWRVRRLMAQEVARYLAGLSTVLLLGRVAGAGIELDPLSSDFLKLKFGNLRLDPTSGFSQVFTLGKRALYRQRKDQDGNIDDLSGYDMDRMFQRFARYKLSPALGIAWSGMTGQTPFDGPATWGWAAKEMVTPMSLDDVLTAADDQGIPRSVVFSTWGFFGAAVQVYGDNTMSSGPSRTYDRGAL